MLLSYFSDSLLAPLLYILAAGHITNVCTTIYLHRTMTHGGLVLKEPVSYVMRFWLWLTTGMVTKEWVACHRKHHAFADKEGDPHSPALSGLLAIVLNNVTYYRRAVKDQEMLMKYGKGCPEDWIEKHVFTPFSWLGLVVLLCINLFLFGFVWGFIVWVIQVTWMPLMGGVVNGIGHAIGYRNFDVKDRSRNFFPLGMWIAGEELHNNHHSNPASPKFSVRWWEFDIGWAYVQILRALGLAETRMDG